MKIKFLMKVHIYKFFSLGFESNSYGREKRKKKREKDGIRMIFFTLQQKDDAGKKSIGIFVLYCYGC